MGATSGNIIRITDKQTWNTQTALNIYFYQINDTTLLIGDYLAVVADMFKTTVLDVVKTIQSTACVHENLYLENLSNGVDIETYSTGFPVSGSITNTNETPPFVSYGFQLFREERTTRNGYKRFAGVDTGQILNGVYTGSMTPIHNVENALAADLVSGIVHVCNPVIVRHPITVPLVSPVLSHIGSALFKGVGTQNTRKMGRGI